MRARSVLLAAVGGLLAPEALLAQAGALDDAGTMVLVVVVTGVLTAVLVLIFRAANRLQERLTAFFGSRRSVPAQRPVAAPVAPRSPSAAELELAEVLTAAGPEGARRWLEGELGGRDPLRLRQVLELLPDLGEEHSRPLSEVILRLAGEGADLGVRTRALRALGGLKIPFDAAVRRILEKARGEGEPALKNAAVWAWCELGRPEDLGLVKVPAGEFLMGSVEEKDEILSERPQHTLFLPAFYIGRYPVTVRAFAEFLAASGHKLEKEGRFREGNQQEDHPAVRVSWTDALEYARWHGMSLPSEAEWEKAARGTDGRRYPWGNEWKAGHANTLESWPSRRKATTTPVGSFSPHGDSPYGCGDMAGNVWEWTRGVDGPYPYDPADGREDLLACQKGWQIVRGGALDNDSRYARCAVRSCDDFRDPPRYVGFRLVTYPYPL